VLVAVTGMSCGRPCIVIISGVRSGRR